MSDLDNHRNNTFFTAVAPSAGLKFLHHLIESVAENEIVEVDRVDRGTV
jgi:hypothetical protein